MRVLLMPQDIILCSETLIVQDKLKVSSQDRKNTPSSSQPIWIKSSSSSSSMRVQVNNWKGENEERKKATTKKNPQEEFTYVYLIHSSFQYISRKRRKKYPMFTKRVWLGVRYEKIYVCMYL